MNIFGAFTFGSVIKTFIPGLVWLGAVLLLEANLAQWLGYEKALMTFAAASPQAFLVLSIPAGILLGLFSNTLVFMGLNDLLIRDPARRNYPALFEVKSMVDYGIKEMAWVNLNKYIGMGGSEEDVNMKYKFYDVIDPEVYIMNIIGFENLTFTREQYWFHLEFQLNMLVSTLAVGVASLIYVAVYDILPAAWGPLSATIVVVTCALAVLLYFAARKNYNRHIEKMISLMAGALDNMTQKDIRP